jgi:hypothetical protein
VVSVCVLHCVPPSPPAVLRRAHRLRVQVGADEEDIRTWRAERRKRKADVKAKTFCSLFVLSAADFREVRCVCFCGKRVQLCVLGAVILLLFAAAPQSCCLGSAWDPTPARACHLSCVCRGAALTHDGLRSATSLVALLQVIKSFPVLEREMVSQDFKQASRNSLAFRDSERQRLNEMWKHKRKYHNPSKDKTIAATVIQVCVFVRVRSGVGGGRVHLRGDLCRCF